MPAAPTGFLYRMLRKKNITVDGKKAEGRHLLAEGEAVRLYFSDETIRKFQAKESAEAARFTEDVFRQFENRVLFLDGDILAFDKPAGMPVQRTDPRRTAKRASGETADYSLAELLPEYLLWKGKYSGADFEAFRPAPANRLDRNTSGIVLCGISLPALQYLAEVLRGRVLKKYYLAVVCGRMESTGILEGWYARDAHRNEAVVYPKNGEGRERILTGFETVAAGDRFSLVRAELITGRTHQIRAHLKSLGHPVAGDPKYGIPSENAYLRRACGVQRQLLHAAEVHFPDGDGFGDTYRNLVIRAPLPDDLLRVIQSEFRVDIHEQIQG